MLGQDCGESIYELMAQLISAPVLTLPSGNSGFFVYSDGCGPKLGHVLVQ